MSEALWVAGGDDDVVVPAAAVAVPVVVPAPVPAAAAAGAEPPGVPVSFMGATFHLRPVEEYQWELLVFADAALGGPDAAHLAANAATLRLIKSALVEGEWPAFSTLASRERAQTKRDLMPLVMAIHYPATARPTQPPSGSSAGRPSTPPSSEDELSSRVIDREVAAGRPDRAQFVAMAQEAETAGRSGI